MIKIVRYDKLDLTEIQVNGSVLRTMHDTYYPPFHDGYDANEQKRIISLLKEMAVRLNIPFEKSVA